MIFQYPRKSEGVTEKASRTPLLDLGTSEAAGKQANPLSEPNLRVPVGVRARWIARVIILPRKPAKLQHVRHPYRKPTQVAGSSILRR